MGIMFDSDDAAALPAGAEIVAGYVDGEGAGSYDAAVARFPNAQHVSITVLGAPGARVADCEAGNPRLFPPSRAAAWAADEIRAGRRPTIYHNLSSSGAVNEALTAGGVLLDAVDRWVADWTGAPHLIPGSVATQYASPETGSGGHYDISETNGTWPGAPAPPPKAGFMPPTLQTRDLSPAVRSAQSLLNLHNADLAVDGDFGPLTEQAVRNFQTVFRLAVDGIVGPVTWSHLCTFG